MTALGGHGKHAPKLVVLRPRSTVFDAARALRDNHVGAILVTDDGHLVGIVTDRDLALAITRDAFDAHTTRLVELMTDVVGTCDENASILDLVTTMRLYACRRVPVMRDGGVVGMVTLDDLIVEDLAAPEDVRAVIVAQLEQPARLKPAGLVRPSSPARPRRDPRPRSSSATVCWWGSTNVQMSP
jgi:CBS domain-containing protein